MDLNEFESRLRVLLAEAGCVRYGVSDLHRDTRECRDGIYADDTAHGQLPDSSFYYFIVAEGVAVFTFFESDFSVYVFRCDEHDLITETDPLALDDTDACKALLASKYRKTKPDLVIARGLAENWLSS